MFPVQDVIPSRTTPWVTAMLIGVNCVVIVCELLASEAAVRSLILSYGLLPAHPSGLSALTSMFLHHGAIDAGVNMLALWIYGDNLEDRLGHTRFLLFYLGLGVFATMTGAWTNAGTLSPIIGASGAVGAVIGGYLALFPRSRVLVAVPVLSGLDLVEVPALLLVGFWILLQAIGSSGYVAGLGGLPVPLWIQLTGCAAGAAFVWAARRPERQRVEWWSPR